MLYTHIWFDLGLTLVGNNRAGDYKEVLSKFGVEKSKEEIELAYHMADKLFMKEYPNILGKAPNTFMPWYLGILNYKLGIQLDIFEVINQIKKVKSKYENESFWQAFDFTRDTLMKLKDMGIKLGLISNWDMSCRNVLRENNLIESFDTIIISAELGCEKPSRKIFEEALKKGEAFAHSSLYVGDNYYDDVVGAAKVGMKCLLINPFEKRGIEELDHPYIIKDIREVLKFVEEPFEEKNA